MTGNKEEDYENEFDTLSNWTRFEDDLILITQQSIGSNVMWNNEEWNTDNLQAELCEFPIQAPLTSSIQTGIKARKLSNNSQA